MSARVPMFRSLIACVLVTASAIGVVGCSGDDVVPRAAAARPTVRPEGVPLAERNRLERFWSTDASGARLVRIPDEVLFDIDSAKLKPSATGVLDEIAGVLADDPRSVEIGGFTDNTGTPAHNDELSGRRARVVARRLIDAGVDPQRVSSRGYGERSPVASNDTDAGRRANRRVEIRLVGAQR